MRARRSLSVRLILLASAALIASAPEAAVAAKAKKKHRAEADTTAPLITHQRVTRAPAGAAIAIRAQIEDESEIFAPAVFVRPVGQGDFESLGMRRSNDGWEATIPAEMVTTDLEYFIEAFDDQGNGPAREGAPESPIRIEVAGGRPSAGASKDGDVRPPPSSDGNKGPVAPLPGATQTGAGLSTPNEAGRPKSDDDGGITSKWWFWTIIGVAVTAGIAGAVIGLQSKGNVDAVDIQVRGPAPTRGL